MRNSPGRVFVRMKERTTSEVNIVKKSHDPFGESGGEVALMPSAEHQTLRREAWVCFLLAVFSLLQPCLPSVNRQQHKLPSSLHTFVSVLTTSLSP